MLTSKEAEEKRQKFLMKYFSASILATQYCNFIFIYFKDIYKLVVQYCNIILLFTIQSTIHAHKIRPPNE